MKENKKAAAADESVAASLADLMPIIEERLLAGQPSEIMPRGVSMLPTLVEKRDSVILSPIMAEPRKYDIILYKRECGAYILHRIVKIFPDAYLVIGDNQFAPERVPKGAAIAVVSAIRRRDKLIKADSAGERIFAWFWTLCRPVRRIWRKILRKLRSLTAKK